MHWSHGVSVAWANLAIRGIYEQFYVSFEAFDVLKILQLLRHTQTRRQVNPSVLFRDHVLVDQPLEEDPCMRHSVHFEIVFFDVFGGLFCLFVRAASAEASVFGTIKGFALNLTFRLGVTLFAQFFGQAFAHGSRAKENVNKIGFQVHQFR